MVLVLCKVSAQETEKTWGDTNLALDENPTLNPPCNDPVDQGKWLNFRPPIRIHGGGIFGWPTVSTHEWPREQEGQGTSSPFCWLERSIYRVDKVTVYNRLKDNGLPSEWNPYVFNLLVGRTFKLTKQTGISSSRIPERIGVPQRVTSVEVLMKCRRALTWIQTYRRMFSFEQRKQVNVAFVQALMDCHLLPTWPRMTKKDQLAWIWVAYRV